MKQVYKQRRKKFITLQCWRYSNNQSIEIIWMGYEDEW